MRQRKLGSHTPPCHRRMVITTLFIALGAMRQRKLGSHRRCGGGGDYGMAQLVAARRLRLATGGPTMLVQHVWTLGLPVIKELQGHVGLTVRRAA